MSIKGTIESIYESGSVMGRSGKVHQLHSFIDREEGEFLFSIIDDDPAISTTLEIGCAFGLSALHICSAISERTGRSHTLIDPFQETEWDNAGVINLEEAEVDFFNLIPERSEFALPRLLEQHEGGFDFVFVDGWHTFDHTLVDCFYATRLLRVGGVLAIDDLTFPAVRRVVEYLKCYPCYQEIGFVGSKRERSWKNALVRSLALPFGRDAIKQLVSARMYRRMFDDATMRMIALRKTSEDNRSWNWHVDTF